MCKELSEIGQKEAKNWLKFPKTGQDRPENELFNKKISLIGSTYWAKNS